MQTKSMPTGITVLKWYFIILGILNILVALALPSMIAVFTRLTMEAAGQIAEAAVPSGIFLIWGFLIASWAMCSGIFHIIVGLHLSKGYRWARVGAIIVGVWSLCSIPIGTVLGILCLAFLENEEGWAYFYT